MHRLSRITERIAASPFPITDDMLAFARECLTELARLSGVGNRSVSQSNTKSNTKSNAQDAKKVSDLRHGANLLVGQRVVQGPYHQKARVSLFFVLGMQTEAVTNMRPQDLTKGSTAPVSILVIAPLFEGGPTLWEEHAKRRNEVGEVILHELIHCFDPKLREKKLRNREKGRAGRDQEYGNYVEDPTEMTAFEGSFRAEAEAWKAAGLTRAQALDKVRKFAYGSDVGRSSVGRSYDLETIRNSKNWKSYLTRIYKIVDAVFSATPPALSPSQQRPIPPVPTRSRRVKKVLVPGDILGPG